MDRVHVILLGLPRMLGELICRAVSGHADIDVAARFDRPDEAARFVAGLRRRYVVIGASDVDPDAVPDLVGYHPHAKLLALTQNGRRTLLYELRPHRVVLGEVSSEALVDAIRTIDAAGSRPVS